MKFTYKNNIRRIFSSFLLIAGVILAPQAIFSKDADDKPSKNIVMVLDVKRHEQGVGACAHAVATALQDEVAPLMISAHSLEYVRKYFKPWDWAIYTQENMLLLIPHEYMDDKGFKSPEDCGFDLDAWREHKNYDTPTQEMQGSEFLKSLNIESIDYKTFDNLSDQSTRIICDSFIADQDNHWKVYAVGHGASEEDNKGDFQICGLNLEDFKTFLNTLRTKFSTDFLVYQTCFGGGPNQLRSVYYSEDMIDNQFAFPIISGCLSDSVSFGFHPSMVSYKGIFNQVDTKEIKQGNMSNLITGVDQLNKGFTCAMQKHVCNNLLQIRMPNEQHFSPVYDNVSLFKLSDLPNLDSPDINQNFQCFLIDNPVLDQHIDLSILPANTFIIVSGISRDTHYINELTLPADLGYDFEQALLNLPDKFCAMSSPNAENSIYIDKLNIGEFTFDNVTIVQEEGDLYSYSPVENLKLSVLYNGSYYTGQATFSHTNSGLKKTYSTLNYVDNGKKANQYAETYIKRSQGHRNAEHAHPWGTIWATLGGASVTPWTETFYTLPSLRTA